MSQNLYDQACRFAIQLDPDGFIHWLIPGLDPSYRFAGWLDTRTVASPGKTDRICDQVAALDLSETDREDDDDAAEDGEEASRLALLIEFQSEPHPDIDDRLFEYMGLLRRGLRFGPDRRKKYVVASSLVNLTGPARPDALVMVPRGENVPGLHLNFAVRALPRGRRRHHPRPDRVG